MNRNNYEIRDQEHLMDAEGTSDTCVLAVEIKNELFERGFVAYNIDVWKDQIMGFWRWSCKIKKLANNYA